MSHWKLIRQIRKIPAVLAGYIRGQATELIEWEYIELEHIFSVLVLGTLIGLPSPPMQITLDLLPDMEKNLHLLLKKTDTASGPLSELTSVLNVT